MKNMEDISFECSGLLVRKKFREYLAPTILTTISMSLAAMADGALVGNILGDTAPYSGKTGHSAREIKK